MTQLNLFGSTDEASFHDEESVALEKFKLGTVLGVDPLNCQYKFIKLITKCRKCGKGNTIEHFQVFTDIQMIEKGWENIEPFTWIISMPACSRKCENSNQLV